MMKKQMSDMMIMMKSIMKNNNQEVKSETSETSETDGDSNKTFDAQHLMHNLFTRLSPVSGDNPVTIEFLKIIYRLQPEMFKILPGIHTDDKATKTYLSLKVNVTPTFSYKMHINGSLKWHTFKVHSVEMYYKNHIPAVFNYI